MNLYFFFFSVLLSYFCSVPLPCLRPEDKVETFPVVKIDPKDIVDTNGAGDAFVGGTTVCVCVCLCEEPKFGQPL